MVWFGHLERKDAGDWVSACRNMAIVGNARKGRSKKKWNEVVKGNLIKCGLDRGLAKDRERWKARVMEKTSDLCEHGHWTRDVKREEREKASGPEFNSRLGLW